MGGEFSIFNILGVWGRHWAQIQYFKLFVHKLPKQVQPTMPTESNLKTDSAQPPKFTKSKFSVHFLRRSGFTRFRFFGAFSLFFSRKTVGDTVTGTQTLTSLGVRGGGPKLQGNAAGNAAE